MAPFALVKYNWLVLGLIDPIYSCLVIFKHIEELFGSSLLLVGELLHLGDSSSSGCSIHLSVFATVLLNAWIESVEERFEVNVFAEFWETSDTGLRVLVLLEDEVLGHLHGVLLLFEVSVLTDPDVDLAWHFKNEAIVCVKVLFLKGTFCSLR